MRIVFDIDFGSTYSQTYFGIYDFDTNTLEYISQTRLEERVRKGYQVTDLAMKKVDGLKPQIDIVNTCTYAIPTLQKQEEKREYGRPTKSWLNMTQPIYLKSLKSGLYFVYKNVTFAYQKRKKGNEWGVMLPQGMTVDIGIQILYQLVPYFLCGDVFILQIDTANKEVLDFSSLAQLSNNKRIQISTQSSTFYDTKAIRIAGLAQNIYFEELFKQVKFSLSNFRATNKESLHIIDLSNLYTNEQTKLSAKNDFGFSMYIPDGALMLFPNIENYAQSCKSIYQELESPHKKTETEWINIGNIPKTQDYITIAQKQVSKYALMGKKITDYIFYTTII